MLLNKKTVLILILMVLPYKIYSYSAHSEIHKYGFTALGNDISTITYNPAGLVNLIKNYGEFNITVNKEFQYNEFAVGYYLTSFPLFSGQYPTSVNFSLGMSKPDENENFSLGIGGTLVDFWKYGVLIKYNNLTKIKKKFIDYNLGTILDIFSWMKAGLAVQNIKNTEYQPADFMTGLYLLPLNDIILTFGMDHNNKLNKMTDYSFASEINVIGNLTVMGGYQKHIVPFGLGLNFSLEAYKNSVNESRIRSCYREKLYISCNYDKERKKITGVIVSFIYRFGSLINPPYTTEKKMIINKESYTDDDEKKIYEKENVSDEQRIKFEKAKIYFTSEELEDAKKEIEEILKLNKNSEYAQDALKLKKEIEKVERNRDKKRNK